MRWTIFSAIVAGLAAGVVFGLFLTAVTVSGPDQPVVGLMDLAMGPDRLLAGWLVTLGAGALVGLVFGALAGRADGPDAVVIRALGLGLVLWLVSTLIGLPWLMGQPLTAGLRDVEMWAWAAASLAPYLLFASVLAAVFSGLRSTRPRQTQSESGSGMRQAA